MRNLYSYLHFRAHIHHNMRTLTVLVSFGLLTSAIAGTPFSLFLSWQDWPLSLSTWATSQTPSLLFERSSLYPPQKFYSPPYWRWRVNQNRRQITAIRSGSRICRWLGSFPLHFFIFHPIVFVELKGRYSKDRDGSIRGGRCRDGRHLCECMRSDEGGGC